MKKFFYWVWDVIYEIDIEFVEVAVISQEKTIQSILLGPVFQKTCSFHNISLYSREFKRDFMLNISLFSIEIHFFHEAHAWIRTVILRCLNVSKIDISNWLVTTFENMDFYWIYRCLQHKIAQTNNYLFRRILNRKLRKNWILLCETGINLDDLGKIFEASEYHFCDLRTLLQSQ